MTPSRRARNAPDRHVIGTDGRQIIVALMSVALVVAVLGLAAIGLDTLNDVLARGFSSAGNPSG